MHQKKSVSRREEFRCALCESIVPFVTNKGHKEHKVGAKDTTSEAP